MLSFCFKWQRLFWTTDAIAQSDGIGSLNAINTKNSKKIIIKAKKKLDI
jgi:hypothetical protein